MLITVLLRLAKNIANRRGFVYFDILRNFWFHAMRKTIQSMSIHKKKKEFQNHAYY